MGRPRIGTELKKPSDYKYSYPQNTEVAKYLTTDDKLQIAFRTGYSIRYIRYWCAGQRCNSSIETLARKIARINRAHEIAKQCKLNNHPIH